MTKKSVVLLTIITLVLVVSACGKKEVASVVSEVTSVTEKVQETSTSIAEKIDSINSTEEKTDLSELPEIEVPDVPDVPEVEESVAMTEEEFTIETEAYAAECIADSEFMPDATEEEKREQALRNYACKPVDNDETLRDVTLFEYFGENYVKIPDASKDETLGEYNDAEVAYTWYSIDRGMAEILDPSKYAGQKELTHGDFHRDRTLVEEWLDFSF